MHWKQVTGILLTAFLFLLSCSRERKAEILQEPDPTVVSAYTGGVVSAESTVRVQFTMDMVDDGKLGETVTPSPFSFSPRIRGLTTWTARNTLEFRPEESLPPGGDFVATVDLSRLLELEKDAGRFSFRFSVMPQSFSVSVEGLHTPDAANLREQVLHGVLRTADISDPEAAAATVSAFQFDKLPISWSHDDDGVTHRFTVTNILRETAPHPVLLKWDGKPLGVHERGERRIDPAPLGDFRVEEVTAIQIDERYIRVRFSDPLRADQNLEGLVHIESMEDLSFEISGSVVRIYSPMQWPGELAVNVEPGIYNSLGTRLREGLIAPVVFENLDPQVSFPGKGVILPTSQGLTIPIETVNLNGVVVEAMRIYEDNVSQFLQVNTMEGDQELRRIGQVVWKRELPIEYAPGDRNRWIRTGLDLGPLVTAQPKGMYRLTLYFRRDQIEFGCPPPPDVEEAERFLAELGIDDEDTSSWDYWDYWELEYQHPEYFNSRFDPCHPAFYRVFYDHDIRVSRNVLISDIGLVVKRGNSDSLYLAASNLKTAQPMAGVDISILNYQRQEVGGGSTDQEGLAQIRFTDRPFLVIAEKGDQAAYLRVDGGTALSVSHFDVDGAEARDGLKGFIYGDRGVWRPGDPIHVTFILLDREKRLPAGHPVELRFIDPRGRLADRRITKDSLGGFYHFPLSTQPDDPTGNWTVEIAVGGTTFEKTIKIETVLPNRLKIDLDFGPEEASLSIGILEGTIASAWLHGAPARNLRADVTVSFSSVPTRFSTHGDFIFDDPVRVYYTESQSIFDGVLDGEGRASIRAEVYTQNESPGMLRADFDTRVFEPGGAASSDRLSMSYHPYDRYIGIKMPRGDEARGMLLTDTEHGVQIVAVDGNGDPVPRARVLVELYQINWRWWWEKGEEDLASFLDSTEIESLESEEVLILDGKGAWSFEIQYPSWGRYLVRVRDPEGGHATGAIVYVDWPGWAGRAQTEGAGGASVLAFTADRESYESGDVATLTIPTATEGMVLVSVEAGGSILSSEWIEAAGDSTRYSFEVTEEMAPNAYVHAHFLQPHLQSKNDVPIRLYGIIPLLVEDSSTRLEPVIESADVFHPEEEASVTIREASGRPMFYTLAVVDEGLLSLTRFQTPDPWNHFYRREANVVRTWDFYDLVAAAYGGVLEQLLAVGGGGVAEPAGGGEAKANRFPPLVRFLGPFELAAGGQVTHAIDIPRYVGAVRVMCVAGRDRAFGAASREVLVKKPLMVLGTLPRVLGTGETVDVPVSVFVLDEGLGSIEVSLDVQGPVAIEGPASRSLQFSGVGDRTTAFRIGAGNTPGIGRATIKARAGGERASQQIEFDVRVPSEPVVDVYAAELQPGRTWSEDISLPGVAGTNGVTLEVSRIPPIDLGKRLSFLVRYPFGCLEQVTSAVFPQLFLNSLVGLAPEQAEEVQGNVEQGIERIRKFQTTDGGFAYWPGGAAAHEWVTSYAGHFLLEAENVGYYVPPEVREKWIGYERERAFSWTAGPERAELQQAYRLYCLALAGEPALGAMNRLRLMKKLPPAARWRLAAAYQLAGRPEVARELTAAGVPVLATYRELGGTYGSDLRDRAMILETAVLTGQAGRAQKLMADVSRSLGEDRWLSTQDTAFALLAVARYAGVAGDAGVMDFGYRWNGGTRRSAGGSAPLIQIPLPAGGKRSATLEVRNEGDFVVYPRLIVEGTPLPGEEQAAAEGLSLSVQYLGLNNEPVDPEQLEQGTDFKASITVSNTGSRGEYREIALTHVVPSGWEIVHRDTGQDSPFEYRDIRDDRVYTYFDLEQGARKNFTILLNASYTGSFYLPLVKAEAMYDATIHARTAGRWIRIVRPGVGTR
jgi:uncharacterized protein YfaS (alpha-2-macroglobulin family)